MKEMNKNNIEISSKEEKIFNNQKEMLNYCNN